MSKLRIVWVPDEATNGKWLKLVFLDPADHEELIIELDPYGGDAA